MANRLKTASSAYLRTAADSPIDWYPWGTEAFDRAKREDKPILLDIGAVWCHWCHVMDHGTYEHPEVVRRLNEGFVCIKVDRDERPDVDIRYQRAVGALTGQGGWPLTAFLTPDGRVFYGGTYFPPDDAHGRPGFPNVLQQIETVFRDERERVNHSAEHLAEALATRAKGEPAAEGTVALDQSLVDVAVAALRKEHDSTNGGFGGAPKFPHTGALDLAITVGMTRADTTTMGVATHSLEKMADGGIHDQVAGGFHRYAVDAHWTVPHFEKMTYDNAELLRVYAHAYAATGDARYKEVAGGIVDWVLETLADREHGGFGASQDADVGPHDDGDHFTWTLDELRRALAAVNDPELSAQQLYDVARLRFGVAPKGDMHHDPARNVLEIDQGHEAIADQVGLSIDVVRRAEGVVLKRLREVRAERPVPFVDPTRYTDWNGMMASAFLEAGAILERDDVTRHALRTLERIAAEAWDDERGWAHRPQGNGDRVDGLLDDQAWMGLALLDAHRFAGRDDFTGRIAQTADLLVAHHTTPKTPGFTDTASWLRKDAVAAPLAEPNRPFLDQSAPGGNPIAARFLLRAGRLLGRTDLVESAKRALSAHAHEAPRMGIFAASWTQAVEEALADPPLVTVLGAGDDPATVHLLSVARRTPRPGTLVVHVEPTRPESAPEFLRDVVGNEDLVKDGPVALVCHGDRCDALEQDAETLADRILGRPPRL